MGEGWARNEVGVRALGMKKPNRAFNGTGAWGRDTWRWLGEGAHRSKRNDQK